MTRPCWAARGAVAWKRTIPVTGEFRATGSPDGNTQNQVRVVESRQTPPLREVWLTSRTVEGKSTRSISTPSVVQRTLKLNARPDWRR